MCITESVCCTPESNTTLQITYTSIKKKTPKPKKLYGFHKATFNFNHWKFSSQIEMSTSMNTHQSLKT